MNPITVNMDFAELKKNFLEGKEIDLVLFLRGIENMNERFNYIPELVEFIFESISLIKYLQTLQHFYGELTNLYLTTKDS